MAIFEDAETLIRQTMADLDGVDVEYHSAESVFAVRARMGNTLFRAEDRNGTVIRLRTSDFLIFADDLSGHVPVIGDFIVCHGRKHMVYAPNDEPCWRWHDRHCESLYRIHTQVTAP